MIVRLDNAVRPYAWGSTDAIPRLLGRPASSEPQAELWMGAHPASPSRVEIDGESVPLDRWIASQPERILGERVAHRFGGALPFLFKVLSAARPLSLQAHPDRRQAEEGFEREERLGIPLDGFHRSYKDRSHKPEMLCALTPFRLLHGFRPTGEILALLEDLALGSVLDVVHSASDREDERSLRHLFARLLELDEAAKQRLVRDAVAAASRSQTRVAHWILRLHELHPGDIGILAPVLLHLVHLEPGQALFLTAGTLHSYLDGTGIELMASSDNVLRGALTTKHVDVPELLRVVRFEPTTVEILEARPSGPGERLYPGRAEEFCLAVVEVSADRPHERVERRSVEILLCVEGGVYVESPLQERLEIRTGESFVVPACVERYRLSGDGRLYRASVPASS